MESSGPAGDGGAIAKIITSRTSIRRTEKKSWETNETPIAENAGPSTLRDVHVGRPLEIDWPSGGGGGGGQTIKKRPGGSRGRAAATRKLLAQRLPISPVLTIKRERSSRPVTVTYEKRKLSQATRRRGCCEYPRGLIFRPLPRDTPKS